MDRETDGRDPILPGLASERNGNRFTFCGSPYKIGRGVSHACDGSPGAPCRGPRVPGRAGFHWFPNWPCSSSSWMSLLGPGVGGSRVTHDPVPGCGLRVLTGPWSQRSGRPSSPVPRWAVVLGSPGGRWFLGPQVGGGSWVPRWAVVLGSPGGRWFLGPQVGGGHCDVFRAGHDVHDRDADPRD